MGPKIPEGVAERWRNEKGCCHALDVYYVSNLAQENLHAAGGLLRGILGDTSFVQLVSQLKEEENCQFRITQRYTGAFQATADRTYRTMAGTYLRVIIAYPERKLEVFVDELITRAANLLRLRFGIGAALERAEAIIHDLTSGRQSKHSEAITVRVAGDGKMGDRFYENSVKSGLIDSDTISLNPDASILLNAGLENHDRRQSFLLLWMALEAQVGDGRKRKRFCEADLRSSAISDEMVRLHSIRSGYAHSRDDANVDERSLRRVLETLRISTLPEGPVRATLVRLLEAELQSGPLDTTD